MPLFGKQLKAYLAYSVHGKKDPSVWKKSPQMAKRGQPRKGPPRDETYKAWIRSQPSIISNRYGCDACHTGTDGGMRQKASDYSCLPMTRAEHQEYHRIGRNAFARKYALDYGRLASEFTARYFNAPA